MAFTKLGLSEALVKATTAAGYTTPTPIQSLAIPIAITGADLIGCAQTGTGKTAAFVLPMLQRLSLHPATPQHKKHVRALILTPTRELAVQVDDFIKSYGTFLKLRTLCVYGGVSISAQLDGLRRGVDIVIATPGRLLDHIDRRSIDLSKVEIMVIDEADRMFDMGFINDVRTIIAKIPKERQTMLFSATMTSEVRGLASTVMQNPQSVEVGGRRDPAASVTQHVYRVPKQHKLDLLIHILNTAERDNVLVFSRTKHGADKITRRLDQKGIQAVAIHSNRTQAQRQRALDGFKQGLFKVLVATDIAARGIDVEGITHVINFDTPTHPEDYIHRIGRTGRASATGDALTFVSSEEEAHMRDIERYTGKRYERKTYEGFTPVPQSVASAEKPQQEVRDIPDNDRQPESNNTPMLERGAPRGRGPSSRGPQRDSRGGRDGDRPSSPNRGRPASARDDRRGPPSRPSRPRPSGPRDDDRGNRPRSGDSRSEQFSPSRGRADGPPRSSGGPRTSSDPRSGSGPRSFDGPRSSSGPRSSGGPRSSSSPRPTGGPRASGGPRSSGGPQRRRTDDRRGPSGVPGAPQAGDHSSLHLYSKTKPFKKNIPSSRFTGALFAPDDAGFVHPLSKDKKKKFGWNPFKKK